MNRVIRTGALLILGGSIHGAAQPAILSQPQDQSILEGANASFTVEASGVSPIQYQWRVYNSASQFQDIPGATNTTLLLTNVPFSFRRFAVVIQDSQGVVTSRLARILFQLYIAQQPADQSATQSLTAVFQVVGGGVSNVSYQWIAHGLPTPGETSTNLVLPDIQPEDAGEYSAVVSNSFGSITSRVALLTVTAVSNAPPRRSFVNFETPPVHPLVLSPNGATLAVCNLPDNRLELFDVRSGFPVPAGNVSVGLDPVSVRFRHSNEVWVVNQISDSVSVVDVEASRVVATIRTRDAPADVVFAGSPPRAFVSSAMENNVQVFDPLTRELVAEIEIDGDRPKAMAASPDGQKVYVAIFESGNASTILGPPFGLKDIVPPPGVLEFSQGPYAGQNPPPNDGTNFTPAINSDIPSDVIVPREGHIVRKNDAGRWMDDNEHDWTEFVSGSQAALSGRPVGWDIPDHDVAIIDTETLAVSYANNLMTLCMDVAVNPATGQITVIGTDARNEVRFEPILNGVFLRVNLARVDPNNFSRTISDLNPHLDYVTRTLPVAEREKSVGDPRGIIWNSAGTRGYVTGMGSGNLITIGANGQRLSPQPVKLGEGACGLALDETRHRLYVLNRFAATISVVETEAEKVIGAVPLFDPTPQDIKAGRRHLYDTHKTSGLGHVSCASCHPDARMDRLAWDLGNPAGSVVRITNNITGLPRVYHPMKGPMVTQTLQDIIGHEPFHWRADRLSIEEFNPTFTNLQAAASTLTTIEMQELKSFLKTLTFPPNRFRNFDNTLSTNLPLPGHFASGLGELAAGAPLPNGNAHRGLSLFADCLGCHRPPAGLVPQADNLAIVAVPPPLQRNRVRDFKGAQLRNLQDKVGMNTQGTSSRAGFGFSFNGRVDSLSRFFDHGFPVTLPDRDTADMVALLLSFAGSDFSTTVKDRPGMPSQDMPAAVGKQTTLNSAAADPMLDQMLTLARPRLTRMDLVVKGTKDGQARSWLYDRRSQQFESDRKNEFLSTEGLRQLAESGNEFTYTLVPRGTGRRIGLDRDADGFYDRDEMDFGSDPANPFSIPLRVLASVDYGSRVVTIAWNSVVGETYRIQFKNTLTESNWSDLGSNLTAVGTTSLGTDALLGDRQRFYRIQLLK
jgi:YVTN family beta-propeller protein